VVKINLEKFTKIVASEFEFRIYDTKKAAAFGFVVLDGGAAIKLHIGG
jgi:hypothetical protein